MLFLNRVAHQGETMVIRSACDISIIIRSLNEERVIGDCLASIARQKTEREYEVVCVDSGSTDRTLDIISRYGHRLVKIKQSDFSFGGSLNKGIAVSSGRIIVSLSAHCVPIHDHWLQKLTEPLFEGEAEIVVGGQTGFISTRTSEKNYFKKRSEQTYVGTLPVMDNANSAFLRRFWELEPFDESMTGQEDIAFMLHHIKNSKIRVLRRSDAMVSHFHNFTNKQVAKRVFIDTRNNLKLGVYRLAPIEFFWGFFHDITKDIITAYSQRKFMVAFPGILMFRLYELFASLRAFLVHKL
jgi:glycosyltransferase involved in cell wall biosynthesis